MGTMKMRMNDSGIAYIKSKWTKTLLMKSKRIWMQMANDNKEVYM